MSKSDSQFGMSLVEVEKLKNLLQKTCKEHLDKAERDWCDSGAVKLLGESVIFGSISKENFSVKSNIPKHELVSPFEPKVDKFIAIVCDIRHSTRRIRTIDKNFKVNGIERVFYETSALLPVIEETLNYFGGKVTEYLGDGILGFMHYTDDEQIYKAYHFSKCCLSLSLDIVNNELRDRYNLEPLSIGIGMGFSDALIRVVTDNHVKAFGACVWEATKLSDGYNKVYISESLKAKWPSSATGSIRFERKHDKEKGYLLFPQK